MPDIAGSDKHEPTSLRGIAKKAKEDPRHRFTNLYSLLNEATLRESFSKLNRKAAPGVDAVDYEAYEENLEANISNTVRELKDGNYKAKLVRRHYIPEIGGRRPLGIPVVGEKVVQTAAAQILSAIYEQDFLECSHGYRRARGPQRAALELSKKLHWGRYGWVVDADIKGFFDNLGHEWLMRMLEQRINDRRFLGLIRKWLKAGILEEDGKVIYPITGTPQGGVISAVLANIYLHYALDLWVERVVKPQSRGDVMLMRFADDLVCCFQLRQDCRKFYKELEMRLGKFELALSAAKTRVIKFTRFVTRDNDSFSFLGFEYRWSKSRAGKPLVTMRTARKKYQAAVSEIQTWISKTRCRAGTKGILQMLRQKLQGHWNYYGVSGNSEMFNKYNQAANHRVLELNKAFVRSEQ